MYRLLILIAFSLFIGAEEKSTPAGKEENWLQKNIEEQQKLQANRTASDADKINPFQGIEKPNPEKPKSSEPFALIRNNSNTESKAPTKIEAPRPVNSEITFKPIISGMLSDSSNEKSGEKLSKSVVEKIDFSNRDSEEFSSKEEDPIEKIRKERLQKNLNSKSEDKLFNSKFDLPSSFDLPNSELNRRNPNLSENKNRFQQNQETFGNNSVNRLPTIQMIKPIETPQIIQNPALNRSVFENQNQRKENQKNIYNQMMTTPGTGKSRTQDPNDFIRR